MATSQVAHQLGQVLHIAATATALKTRCCHGVPLEIAHRTNALAGPSHQSRRARAGPQLEAALAMRAAARTSWPVARVARVVEMGEVAFWRTLSCLCAQTPSRLPGLAPPLVPRAGARALSERRGNQSVGALSPVL